MTRAAPRDRAGTARAALGALVSGIVFALTAPPTDAPLGLLAGLVGFALCMPPAEGEPRARRAVLVGLMFGLGANLVALRFVPEVITRFTPLGQAPATLALVLLSLAQAIPWLLGALSAHVLARRGVARWLAFACGVYVATFVPAIFPWTPAGGLATWPWMIQLADVVGERGVSLLIAAATGLFADAVTTLRRGGTAPRASVVPMAIGVALLVFCLLRLLPGDEITGRLGTEAGNRALSFPTITCTRSLMVIATLAVRLVRTGTHLRSGA